MSESGIDESSTEVGETSTQDQRKEAVDSLGLFLFEVKNLFPILDLKANIRATHRGLFVTESYVENLLSAYRQFLEKQTSGEVHKSIEKSKKRLFGSLDPEGYYLLEGKNTLSGFLVAYEIKDPQKLGLPFYLGSLSSKKSFLHAKDPILSSLKDVEVITEASGASLKVKLGPDYYNIPSVALRYFVNVAKNSQRTLQEYPEIEESLGVQCKAFVSLFRKSKQISPENLLLVPESYNEVGRYVFRLLGSMVFVFDKRRTLVSVYGLKGKDLFRLIKREFSSVRGRHLGSFEIYPEKHRLLGSFRYSERNHQLSVQALMDYLLEIPRSPDKKDKLTGIITVRRLFERYSELFQSSQPIQKHLIKAYLSPFKKFISECRINGVWIFVVTSDSVIEATVPKF